MAEHCGAKLLKRTGLRKPAEELQKQFGTAAHILGNEKLSQIKVLGGKGKTMATILVGATTGEVVGEKERIAKDAASSVQSALQKGLVAGAAQPNWRWRGNWSKIKTHCPVWRYLAPIA